MSKKNENSYRVGSAYYDIMQAWRKSQITTRRQLLDAGFKTADITVVLSPRKSSKRGDPRGNMSAQGHLYFAEKLGRKIKGGIKEPQKFRLRWRSIVLEPRGRKDNVSIAPKKVATKAKVKAPAKAPAKIKAIVKA